MLQRYISSMPETTEIILEAIKANPTISMRQPAALTKLSIPRIYQLLKELKIEMRWTVLDECLGILKK
jgi:hypothetical protein